MNTQSSSNQTSLHLPNPKKSLQFRQVEVSESDNLFHDHIQGEDENDKDVQMADHLRPMEELLRIPIVGIENDIVIPAVLADEFELKTELLDFDFLNTAASGNLMFKNTQEALTIIENRAKVEALISSMQEAYNQNQEASIQLMQNQMGQMEETFQERPSCVPSSDTETYPQEERKAVTTMSGLTLDGSFIPHFNFLFYQEKEQESETITEVVEIASSQSTPLVPPLETPPLSAPKPEEDRKPNPHQLSIPSWFKEEIFQALENPTGRADHFVYKIDIVDSLCDKFPIKNNSLSGNPTPSDSMVESPSPSPIPYEDSDSLIRVVAVPLPILIILFRNDDHIEEKSSGSTTTHSDFSLPGYDSVIFDLSIDPFPPANRSDSYHEEFADELAHIISPPEYDHFYFDLDIVPGDFTRVLKDNIFDLLTKGLKINDLNDSSLLLSNCDSSLSTEFSEIDPLVSFPSGNEDIIFDLGIFIIKGVQSERLYILPLDDFSTTSFVSDSLLLTDPFEIDTFLSFPSGNEDKIFDPEILLINGIFSFTRKSPHLLSDNFLIDKCHSFSEISLVTESSVSFHPKDKEIQGESS
ncbi:hypothetical protein Tco_0157211 [Tanacetum coccineum]